MGAINTAGFRGASDGAGRKAPRPFMTGASGMPARPTGVIDTNEGVTVNQMTMTPDANGIPTETGSAFTKRRESARRDQNMAYYNKLYGGMELPG